MATDMNLDPDHIRRTAAEVMSRPEFALERLQNDFSWMGYLFEILWWLLTPLRWLFEVLSKISPGFAWVVIIILVLLLVAIFVHIVYAFLVSVRGDKILKAYQRKESPEPTPAELEARAKKEAAAGNYSLAIRILLWAGLMRTEKQLKYRPPRGWTNRQRLNKFRNRPYYDPLKSMVDLVDLTWFGQQPCHESDYEHCEAEYRLVTSFLREPVHA